MRTGVATDYCVQTLGCSLEDAVRAEAKMLPQVANSVRRDKAEVVCAELRAKLGLSDHEMRKLVLRVPTVLTLNMDKNANPKLDWLQERLDLSRDELKKICLTLPATLAYSVDKNLEPKLSYFEHELGMSPQDPVQDHLHARPPGLQHREAATARGWPPSARPRARTRRPSSTGYARRTRERADRRVDRHARREQARVRGKAGIKTGLLQARFGFAHQNGFLLADSVGSSASRSCSSCLPCRGASRRPSALCVARCVEIASRRPGRR